MASDFEFWAQIALQKISDGVNLVSPSPNQSLFKYISLSSEKSWNLLAQTLHSRVITGSPADELNDPFEISPTIYNDLRNSELVRKQAGLSNPIPGFHPPAQQFQTSDEASEIALSYFQKLRSETRIISFSERYDSPLLWAHYANNYKGACLHFLGGRMQGMFTQNLARVQYANERPVYPLSLALTLAVRTRTDRSLVFDAIYERALSENDKLCYFTKAADWAYEREVRKAYSEAIQRRMVFDPTSLVSIVCGPRMSTESRDSLKKIVSESEFSHVPILEAKISSSAFSISVDWQ